MLYLNSKGTNCPFLRLPCINLIFNLCLFLCYYINFDMKQTIRTKNYNAVIQIPYQKMARKPNWAKINAESEQQQCNQHTKTVVVPQCHGCCHQRSNENKVSIAALEQLEVAFERDMRFKNGEIQLLRGEVVGLKSQLSQNKSEIQKMKTSLSNEEIKYMKIIKQRDDEIAKINRQVELGIIERQKMMKAKIAEYQSNYLQYQKNEQEKIRKLEQQYRIKNKQQFSQLQLSYRQQKQSLNNQLLELKLTLQHKAQISQMQIERYGKQVENYKLEVASLKIALGQKQQQNKNAANSINEKDLTIYKLQLSAESIKKQIQQLTYENNRNIQTIQALKQTIRARQAQLVAKQQQINSKCKQYQQLNNECQDILAINRSLQTKCNSLNLQITAFISNKTAYLNKIQQLEISIKSYQEQISRKQVPKLYEVKIEKVIDRQDYIIAIEAELQKYKRNNLELCDKIKQLELVVSQREKQISECKNRILELQEEIAKLRCYIEEKQRSYAWIVQREITRDIQINKGEINKTYKVFPSEPKVFYNFKEVRENQIPVRTFAENENLILEHIESSTLFKNDEQTGQLRKAIMKQLNKDISQEKVSRMQIKSVTGVRQHYQS